MPSIFRNHFHLCFSKIRCLPSSLSPPLTLDDDDDDYENSICFAHTTINNDNNNNLHPSSSILNNFSVVYDQNPSTSSSSDLDNLSSSFSNSSATTTFETPDLSAIFASQRLFVSSPGLSNSILESPSKQLVGGGVPIKKDSPDPYTDFRRSMQEMIEARKIEMRKNQHHLVPLGTSDDFEEDSNDKNEDDDLSEYLNELLLCYLNLNPKHTHKFIIQAFADLLVSLMSTD